MSDSPSPIDCQVAELPQILRVELSTPPLPRRSWVWTIGPAFAGLFIWMPLLDPAGALVLGDAGLGWLAATAVLAVIACHGLLYSIPALWGWMSGRRLSLVGASTFGTSGSAWITGVAVGVAAVVLQAVSIFVAIELTLLGLVSCRLVGPSVLEPWSVGAFVLLSPVFLLTALFWIFVTGVSSLLRLVAVIGALMQVYTPVAFFLLGALALLMSPGLAGFEAVRLSTIGPAGSPFPAPDSIVRLFQLVFSCFALSGMMAVDWGAAVENRRDVRIGGWMSIVLAGSYGLIMAMLTVAGALGKIGIVPSDGAAGSLVSLPLFHRAIEHGLPGALGGVFLLLFGLATLAPACYAAWVHSHRFTAQWPRLRRFLWTWIASLPVFVLIVTSWAGRLEVIFGLLGAVFAPAVGAMVGDAISQKGRWPGVRPGWNPSGILAWGVGVLVGIVPFAGPLIGWAGSRQFQPAALYAFLTSAGIFLIMSFLVKPYPPVPVPDMAAEHVEKAGAATTPAEPR